MSGSGPARGEPRGAPTPDAMRAVVVTAFGGPEVLRATRVPVPSPGPGEVLIRGAFASVNFADLKARSGGGRGATPPFVPGLDLTGRVVAVGDGVPGLRPGQWVAAATLGGTYAELAVANAALTYALPPHLEDLRAAAGVVAMMTAYNALVVKGALAEGETVLVHAAAGGVGTLALQLARLRGAERVIAVVGHEGKVALAREMGADLVVVTRGDGYPERLAEAAPDGVDLVLDAVGGSYTATAFARLAPFGRLVQFGNAAGPPPPLATAGLSGANRAVIGYSSGGFRRNRPEGVRVAAETMLALLARGELRVPIHGTYALNDAAEAHRALASRATTGKLVLDLGADADAA